MALTSTDRQKDFPLIDEYGVRECLSDSFYVHFIGNRVKDLFEHNQECAACEYRYKCWGGCRANAMLRHNGDLYSVDSDSCFLFRNGYPDRIRKAADEAIVKYCREEQ